MAAFYAASVGVLVCLFQRLSGAGQVSSAGSDSHAEHSFMGIQNISDCITKVTAKKAALGTWLVRVLYAGSYVYIAAAAAGCVYTIWRQYYPVFGETLNMVFTGGPI